MRLFDWVHAITRGRRARVRWRARRVCHVHCWLFAWARACARLCSLAPAGRPSWYMSANTAARVPLGHHGNTDFTHPDQQCLLRLNVPMIASGCCLLEGCLLRWNIFVAEGRLVQQQWISFYGKETVQDCRVYGEGSVISLLMRDSFWSIRADGKIVYFLKYCLCCQVISGWHGARIQISILWSFMPFSDSKLTSNTRRSTNGLSGRILCHGKKWFCYDNKIKDNIFFCCRNQTFYW